MSMEDIRALANLVKEATEMLPLKGPNLEMRRMTMSRKADQFLWADLSGAPGTMVSSLNWFIGNIHKGQYARLGMDYVAGLSVGEIFESMVQGCHTPVEFNTLSSLIALEYDHTNAGDIDAETDSMGGGFSYSVGPGSLVKAGVVLRNLATLDPNFEVVGPGLESYMRQSQHGVNVNCTEMLSAISGTLGRLTETRVGTALQYN
jgi:hypothetical protein